MNPTPETIQQVIAHLESIGLIVCKKEPIGYLRNAYGDDEDEIDLEFTSSYDKAGFAIYAAAPQLAASPVGERFCNKCGYFGPNEIHHRPGSDRQCDYGAFPAGEKGSE